MPRQNLQLTWESTDSSNVDAVALDEPTETLCVRFKGGGLYSYMGVDSEEFSNMLMAPSIGKYLNNVIKATKPYTRWDTETELIDHLSI